MSEERKKSRITTACDYCRFKRAKCDGKSPVCTNCSRNETNCTYFKKSKKRGLPTGYISGLETQLSAFQVLLGHLITPVSEGGAGLSHNILQSLNLPQNILQSTKNAVGVWQTSTVHQLFTELVLLHKSEAESHKNSPKTLANPRFLISTPSLETPAARFHVSPLANTDLTLSKSEDHATASLTSPTTFDDFAFVDIDYDSLLTNDIFHFTPEEVSPHEESPPVVLQYHGLSQQISGFSSASIQKYDSFLGSTEKNPFRVGTIFSISSQLLATKLAQAGQVKIPLEIYRFSCDLRKTIESYFQIYHPFMPMLDRALVIRHVAHLQEYKPPIPDLQLCSVISLIWALQAIERVDQDCRLAATYARNAVLALECAPITTIETIQSMVLLGLYFYKAGDWDNSWVLISSCSRMAIDVRLMRHASKNVDRQTNGSHLDNTSRERTWASVYLLNTLLAARMGRSPLIRASDWPTPFISDDGWEEWESWRPIGENQTFEIQSGHCLLVFNELLKIVVLLNKALTCTIASNGILQSSVGESSNNKSVLHVFQQEMKKWREGLPPHCELTENLSPIVSYLHMCQNMVWCVLCIRLIHMNNSTKFRTTIQIRNKEYTDACVSIRRILDSKTSGMMISYPFMDHFILLSLNFPSMLLLNPLASANHTSKIAQFLESALKLSTPYHITWDLYRIENGMIAAEHDYTDVIGSFGNTTELKQSLRPVTTQQPMLDAEKRENAAIEMDPTNTGNFAKLESIHRQRFSSYNKNVPKEELDLFMLDTDFAKSDQRLDRFMKNLGFVSSATELNGSQVEAQSVVSQNEPKWLSGSSSNVQAPTDSSQQ